MQGAASLGARGHDGDRARSRRLELRLEPRKVPAFVDALSGLSDSG